MFLVLWQVHHLCRPNLGSSYQAGRIREKFTRTLSDAIQTTSCREQVPDTWRWNPHCCECWKHWQSVFFLICCWIQRGREAEPRGQTDASFTSYEMDDRDGKDSNNCDLWVFMLADNSRQLYDYRVHYKIHLFLTITNDKPWLTRVICISCY